MLKQGSFVLASGILALDLATSCGYAWVGADGRLHRGSYSLCVTAADEWDLRAWRLGEWLRAIDPASFSHVAYEHGAIGSHVGDVKELHGMLRGVVADNAARLGWLPMAFSPQQVKSIATGKGNAPKAQVMRACGTLLGLVVTDDNEADALWLLVLASDCVLKGRRPPTASRRKRWPGKGEGKGSKQRRLFAGKDGLR